MVCLHFKNYFASVPNRDIVIYDLLFGNTLERQRMRCLYCLFQIKFIILPGCRIINNIIRNLMIGLIVSDNMVIKT